MSSWKHVIREKQHQERSQPKARRKFGLLEKHADYKQRAVDYHRKEDTLNKLKLKSRFKNEDEFYYRMQRSQTHDGVHRLQRSGKQYTAHAKRLMKIQDVNYLHAKASNQQKQIASMQDNLHMMSQQQAPPSNHERMDDEEEDDTTTSSSSSSQQQQGKSKHVVFVDSPEEADEFHASEYFNTPAQLLDRKFNRLTTEQISGGDNVVLTKGVNTATIAQLNKQRLNSYTRLINRNQRLQKIQSELQYLEQQRLLQGKGTKRKIVKKDKFGDVDPSKTVYKWKLQRRR